jgi:deoxyribonuclease-4
MQRFFGCHVSASGGLLAGAQRGEALGVNTIQLHPSPPQRWNVEPFPPGIEGPLLEQLPQLGVKRIFFHAIYLINLATPDRSKLRLARLSLTHALELATRIGGSGVIFHVGSMKDEPNEEEGIKRAAESVNEILLATPVGAPLLLEVAAGSGSVIGDRFEELVSIYELVDQKERVGFALDTQHLWASGYALAEAFDPLLDTIESTVGLHNVHAIHLNDSKTACGSRVDRHENLGDGLIGTDILRAIVRNPRIAEIPLILETPALKDEEGARREVDRLRSYLAP